MLHTKEAALALHQAGEFLSLIKGSKWRSDHGISWGSFLVSWKVFESTYPGLGESACCKRANKIIYFFRFRYAHHTQCVLF
jgi:hypothetical protein